MKDQLIRALIEHPSTYEVEVVDNTMLPKKLKSKSTITLTVKPPTMEVLAKCAEVLMRVPESIRTKQEVALEEAIKHTSEMAEVVAVLAHPKGTPPKWYIPFIKANLTPRELFLLFQEVSMKTQTDFFLSSFQTASLINPMMLNHLTPTPS